MPINTISLSLKQSRVRIILWFVFSIILLSNMAVVPFTTSVVYASSTDTSQSSANSFSPMFSDLNGDGIVNILDLNILAHAFGSFSSHPNWNSVADLNDDDVVDFIDVQLLAKDFGKDVFMKYFQFYGQGDFELFPFCKDGRQDWDWVNGYQMDAEGNLFGYGDSGNNYDVYIRLSTEHVQSGQYSAEFHLGEARAHVYVCRTFKR